MAPPKDIARSYPKRGITADVGFRSEPKFCGDGSVYFDGSSDYAETAASSDLAVGDTFTLTAWVWLNPNPGGASKYALRVGDTGAAAPNIASIGVFGSANPAFYCYNGSGNMSSSITCDSARWYHVASVIKAGAGNSQIFVDGIDVTNSHSTTFNVTSSSSKIRIGDWISGANDWEGHIANACLFTESLTEDQVRQVMRASDYASHAAISTVEAFYPLSADFNDSTGSHNATLTGSVSFGVNRPQLPRGLDLTQNAAQARVYTGRCVDFDGSADKITAAHYNPSGDYLTTTAWVNADTLRIQGLIHNGDTGRNSFLFVMNDASGNADFYWNDTTGDARIRHQTQLAAGRWYHLAAVMDMSDSADHQVTFYIDGIAATGTRTAATWYGDNTYQFGNQYASALFFDGKIADCRIYDVELTQAQIRELYHNPEQVLPTGVSASNLRRYYPLSDYNDTGGTGGRYFQDMGADGEPAEDQGSATMAFAQPVPCPQLGLQQSATRLLMRNASADKATVTLPSAPGSSFSFQIWLYLNSVSFNFALQYGDIDIAGEGLTIRISSGAVTTYDSPDGLLSGLSVSEGEWSHIVYATSDSSPYWRVWVNGTEASSPQALTGGARTGASTSLTIGRSPNYGFTPDGIISNCAFWTTQLDTPDVAALYNSGDQNVDVSTVQSSSLVGWWKCDDFTKFKNYANPGTADATVTGSPFGVSFPENASGSTIVGDFSLKRKGVSVLNPAFDPIATSSVVGVSAEIPGCDAISFDPAKGMSFTLAFRLQSFKPTPTSVWYPRIFAADAAGSDYYLRFNYSHQILNFVFRDSASTVQSYSYTTGTVSDLDWHHIAITIDTSTSPNTTVNLWFDGALINTFSSANHNYAFTPDELRIGTYNYGNGNFPGAIANFRIYQAALSQGEVEQSYSSDMRLIKGLANE